MKKAFEKILVVVVPTFILIGFVISMALGLWFLQGGDLRDIPKGCYNSQGC